MLNRPTWKTSTNAKSAPATANQTRLGSDLSLPLTGGTIKNERERLGSQLTWLERWVVFGGFAVAVGVAIEIGPKVLKREIDNAVIGGAIVILGVAAEAILTFIAA